MSTSRASAVKVMAAAATAALALSACSTSGAASAPAQSSETLGGFLINAEETGIDGAVDRNNAYLSGDGMDLTVVQGSDSLEGECGAALQAVDGLVIDTVGTAAAGFDLPNSSSVAVALFSFSDDLGGDADGGAEDADVEKLYEDVANACTEPVVHEGFGVEYTINPAPNGQTGLELIVADGTNEDLTSVVLVDRVGHHRVTAAGANASAEDVEAVLRNQVDKLSTSLDELS